MNVPMNPAIHHLVAQAARCAPLQHEPPFHDRIVGDETCATLLDLEVETAYLFRPRPTRRTPA